jgi:DNA-binding CsgD family transcriptional regulator
VNRIEIAVESFRDAAMFPARWPQALERVAAALHSDGATLLLPPTRAHFLTASTTLHPLVEQHFKLPFPDSREQRVSPDITEGFKPDQAYFTPEEIKRDPYYQEFLVRHGLGWNAAAALGGGLLMSLKRGNRLGRYERAEISDLNAALPWLRSASRAAALAWRSNFSGRLSAFDQIGRGAILMDERARVVEFNASVQFGDGLDLSDGALQAARAADRTRLARFLAAVVDPALSSSRSGSILALPRPSGRRPWLLDGVPCTDAMRSLHSRATALVLVTDMDRPVNVTLDHLREMFGLTPTEARLARELAGGRSVQQAAAALSISVDHARQRLKSIFLSTDTSSQAQLVALVAKLHASAAAETPR